MPVARPALLFVALVLGILALPGGAHAQATAKQCADRWNDMKAKDQTGDLTYRQFSQACLAGTAAVAKPAEKPATTAETPAKPKTSVPSVGTKPKTTAAAATEREEEDETDKAALTRCNAEWQEQKVAKNLSGAKAWHTFMARCL